MAAITTGVCRVKVTHSGALNFNAAAAGRTLCSCGCVIDNYTHTSLLFENGEHFLYFDIIRVKDDLSPNALPLNCPDILKQSTRVKIRKLYEVVESCWRLFYPFSTTQSCQMFSNINGRNGDLSKDPQHRLLLSSLSISPFFQGCRVKYIFWSLTDPPLIRQLATHCNFLLTTFLNFAVLDTKCTNKM